jgi:uncharacterized membrane protein
MDILGKAQELFTQHMFTIGIGLLVAVILVGCVWFFIPRGSQKSPVLENRARVNEATTSEPQLPTQEQLEEMARVSQPPQVSESQGESQ